LSSPWARSTRRTCGRWAKTHRERDPSGSVHRRCLCGATRYDHIDSLFGDNAIDWDLIERHWTDLLRTSISIREGRVSSVTLLRRLGNHSHKNRLYRALREMGRVIRTVTLLRYLSDPGLREQITAVTNKTEAFHDCSEWLMIRGKSATTIPSTRSG
jgi:TnpA family transposase